MFREMRRNQQALSPEETIAILERGSSGVLALAGDGGYPYAVPLSYAYEPGHLYFHCARSGHKLDALRRDCHASFCVVGQDQVSPEEFTTYYQSAILFGRLRVVEDESEILRAVELLADKYSPDVPGEARETALRQWRAALCILKLEIDHLSGKEARELKALRTKNSP